jgi:outer membrane protein OmpA-like peptidoglycan-associated protein
VKLKFIIPGIVCMIMSFSSFAQTTEQTYYVTIGVYGIHDYAIIFTEKANKNNFSAQYAINPARKLYYVYLYSTTDKVKAIAFMLKIRLETEYKEAWVFGGSLGDALVDKATVTKPDEKPAEVKEVPAKQDITKPGVVVPEVKPETHPVEVKPETPKIDTVVTKPVAKVDTTTKAPVVTTPPVETTTGEKPVKHEGQAFNFKLVSEQTGEIIVGEVHVQESSKASQYQSFRGNEVVYLKAPVNATGSYTIITNAPGYKQIKETVNFKDPTSTAGVTKGDKNEFIIPFTLKLAKTGDYIDFNNVKFIRNSSIMTGESETELDGLILSMKSNPKYKIKIHGHCNGKNDREIVVMGTSTNYFAMDPKNKKETASAMKLSEERALAVKGYLVSKGIEADRISAKGEGGKIPLYPATSTLNAYNDRVEIEVKKN